MDNPSCSSKTNDTPENFCKICNSQTLERLVRVGSKGKTTLKKASIERHDNLFADLDFSQELLIHETCRCDYIKKSNVEAAKRRAEDLCEKNISPVKRKLRRSTCSSDLNESSDSDVFGWDVNCLICGNEANLAKEKKNPANRRKSICSVESSDFVLNIVKMLHPFTDDYHREILKRINSVQDLKNLRAKYHKDCYAILIGNYNEKMKDPKMKQSQKIEEAMEDIYNFLLSSDECQFTISQLKEAVKTPNVIPHEDTIKTRLKNRFPDQIIISSRMGGNTYVCFTQHLYDIFSDAWYKNKEKTIEEEENKLIDSAAELIRRKIKSTICRTDQYPASDSMFNNVNENIPSHLLRFLNYVIFKDKKQNANTEKFYTTKIASIANAIMSAARPKSFISPLQLGTGITFYRKFGSKRIIDLCYQLGFSCSYREVQLYEISAASQVERILLDPFLQFVCDNSDFNIATIDGRGTFHNLGTIEIISPANSLQKRKPIKRLQGLEIPKQSELVEENKIEISFYSKKPGSGLQNIIVKSVDNPSFQITLPDKLNYLWLYFKYLRDNEFLGWNGFMQMLYSSTEDYAVSKINFLPFINASPSDYSTLYTALTTVNKIALQEGMRTCIVTFDQPLYIKARDIVEATIFDGVFMVVRLGGFHLLMSYMGCIGQIMAGSGIKDILATMYAEGSVEKILSGHAYARAVRAHILLQQALSLLIFEELRKENIEFQELLNNEDAFTYIFNINEIQTEDFGKLTNIIECKLEEIEKRGKTCKLWVLYFRMVSLLKNFLASERMGDWEPQLKCIELMIPFFHAAGHFNYAKSARLYVQDMHDLKEKMDPDEYEKFTKKGYFTSRRSNSFFSGIFSDQTIEQTLMRAMSVEGGPFKRGATDSIVFKWIKGILYTKDIIEGLESFCDIQFSKSAQHVDSRDARIKRDKKDVLVLRQCLIEHNPFDDIEVLQNIFTGLIGTDEINCFDALSVGITAMNSINNQNYDSIKLSKKHKVLTLHAVNSKLKIGDQLVSVDPLLLFQRICVMKKSDEELESYLKYELAPFPLSLFDECGMRKTQKSLLYPLFKTFDITLNKETSQYILDGGMLLYRVKWPINCNYDKVFKEYVRYLKRNFGNHVSVVFDSYDEDSNKAEERNRRSLKVKSKEYNFTKDMHVAVTQDKFFSNYKNKSRFISLLSRELTEQGIKCYQAKGEADVYVVEIAIQSDTSQLHKVIVAEDVDILVILTARAPISEEIYFLKLGKQNAPSVVYSSKSFESEYPNTGKFILFSHCFTGCDSTSAFYNKGKKKFIDLLEKRADLRGKVETFYDSNANVEEILQAGRYCTILLFGLSKDIQVNKLNKIEDYSAFLEQMRYESFVKATTKKSAVKLSSLVPTVSALDEHVKRVYLQTQIWLGNKNISCTDWGWTKVDDKLQPCKMKDMPAPEELLKMIFCNCKKGCGSACGCRKRGLYCNDTCANCSGDSCQNCPPVEQEDDANDEEGEEDMIDV